MILKFLGDEAIKKGFNKISKKIFNLLPFMPNQVKRNQRAQEIADKACEKLQLYQTVACPYCFKVRLKINELNLNIELVDTNIGQNRNELIEKGGKSQVPCLRVISDSSTDKWIYESDIINRYLEENFKLLTNI